MNSIPVVAEMFKSMSYNDIMNYCIANINKYSICNNSHLWLTLLREEFNIEHGDYLLMSPRDHYLMYKKSPKQRFDELVRLFKYDYIYNEKLDYIHDYFKYMNLTLKPKNKFEVYEFDDVQAYLYYHYGISMDMDKMSNELDYILSILKILEQDTGNVWYIYGHNYLMTCISDQLKIIERQNIITCGDFGYGIVSGIIRLYKVDIEIIDRQMVKVTLYSKEINHKIKIIRPYHIDNPWILSDGTVIN